jgi:sugar transferase (PEP-CTERM/EpsH1 system associated)
MKILFITSRFPYPLEKGDKLRAYYQIQELSKRHKVILFSITENKISRDWESEIEKITYHHQVEELGNIRKVINLARTFFNKLPFQVNYFFNKRKKKLIDRLILRFDPDIVFCQLIRMSEYVRDTSVPKILDYMDAFSKGIERRLEYQPFYMKQVYRMEYKRLLEYEVDIYDQFNASTIISNRDMEVIPFKDTSKISVVRNGVDFNTYQPQPATEKDFDIVFTGNMSYPPNVAAVLFLHHEILPLVKERHPHIRVLVAGASPVAKIRELNDTSFVVTGWVEHMNDSYARSKIFVAPMQIGTGLQNKLLEAMAMQLPCITTGLVNQSLGALAGEEVLIANTAKEYSDYISRLLDDQNFSSRIGEAGNKFVRANYSWQKMTTQLEEVIKAVSIPLHHPV